jgi:hypothetical protein
LLELTAESFDRNVAVSAGRFPDAGCRSRQIDADVGRTGVSIDCDYYISERGIQVLIGRTTA